MGFGASGVKLLGQATAIRREARKHKHSTNTHKCSPENTLSGCLVQRMCLLDAQAPMWIEGFFLSALEVEEAHDRSRGHDEGEAEGANDERAPPARRVQRGDALVLM